MKHSRRGFGVMISIAGAVVLSVSVLALPIFAIAQDVSRSREQDKARIVALTSAVEVVWHHHAGGRYHDSHTDEFLPPARPSGGKDHCLSVPSMVRNWSFPGIWWLSQPPQFSLVKGPRESYHPQQTVRREINPTAHRGRKQPMNDNLQNALATNFNNLASWVKQVGGATGDFISREAPLFVQEYVAWVFWSNVLAVMVLLGGAATMYGLGRWFHKKRTAFYARADLKYFDGEGWTIGMILSWIAAAVLVSAAAFHFAPAALKAKIAPRVLLVEKAAELVGIRP